MSELIVEVQASRNEIQELVEREEEALAKREEALRRRGRPVGDYQLARQQRSGR